MLSPVEDFWLRWHVEHSQVDLAERARLVLEAEAGESSGQVAASLGLSAHTVEGVLAKFAHDRLATFPRPSLRLAQMIQLDPAETISRRHIARLSKRLFNDTRPLHHLQRKARQLLEAAALLPPWAPPAGTASNGQPEMDLLDGATLAGFGAAEQAKITCVRRLQCKGYRADRDPVFRRLRPTEQSQVRYLAALLLVAQHLDHSGTQTTTLLQADLQADSVLLRLAGANAESDGKYACRHAWLWQPVFHQALQHGIGPRPKSAAEARQTIAKADRDQPVGAVFGEQMAAALRIWQTNLPGAAKNDISGLSDLLAGVGQARAALGAFASVLRRPTIKQVKRPLRDMSQLLTAVIEQHNAVSDLATYANGKSPATAAELQPLQEAWERASRRKLMALRAWLEGEDARRLLAALAAMAQAVPVRPSKSGNIRVSAPVLLNQLCAEVAEREDGVIADRPGTYRRYRQGLASLACMLQALGGQASLGEEAGELLADVQRLEVRIDRWLESSALNDALAEFLDSWAEQQARRKAPQLFGAQSVLAYRQARRAQWSRLRSSLPTDWRPVRANQLRRRVNSLLKQFERH